MVVTVQNEKWEVVGQKGWPDKGQHLAVLVKRDSRRNFLARLLVPFAVLAYAEKPKPQQ